MTGAKLILSILVVIGLILVNAVFVAAEFAVVRVRRTRLEELAGEGRAEARNAIELVDRVGEYRTTTQVGITAASLAIGWLGEPALAHLLTYVAQGDVATGGSCTAWLRRWRSSSSRLRWWCSEKSFRRTSQSPTRIAICFGSWGRSACFIARWSLPPGFSRRSRRGSRDGLATMAARPGRSPSRSSSSCWRTRTKRGCSREAKREYARGQLIRDSSMDLETNASLGLSRENTLVVERGEVPPSAVVRVAQTFR
jgi:hypothetical protein